MAPKKPAKTISELENEYFRLKSQVEKERHIDKAKASNLEKDPSVIDKKFDEKSLRLDKKFLKLIEEAKDVDPSTFAHAECNEDTIGKYD